MTPMHHHLLIRTLLGDLRTLRQDFAGLQESLEDYQALATRTDLKLRDARQELARADDQARQDESDRYNREYDRDKALHDLERARSTHDPWGESRALDRLKQL